MGALRDLAARWRAARQAEEAAALSPDPVAVPAREFSAGMASPVASHTPPPPEVAAILHPVPVVVRDAAPPPRPALPWHVMPYGAERGRAFMEARAERGACGICAGRRWWCRTGADEPPTCTACHPPPPGLAVQRVTT